MKSYIHRLTWNEKFYQPNKPRITKCNLFIKYKFGTFSDRNVTCPQCIKNINNVPSKIIFTPKALDVIKPVIKEVYWIDIPNEWRPKFNKEMSCLLGLKNYWR